jgi:hypothetical protein
MAAATAGTTSALSLTPTDATPKPEATALLAQVACGPGEAARAFAETYCVAAILVALTLVPAFFLPRKREVPHLLDEQDAPPVLMH